MEKSTIFTKPQTDNPGGGFVVSLDLELMWGVYGSHTIASYGRQVLGVRQVVPALLDLFDANSIRATWATVGFLMFDSREALMSALPDQRPEYPSRRDNAYAFLDAVGQDENADPYHFGLSLVKDIVSRGTQELGTHTFSHYYCLEADLNEAAFAADIDAAFAAFAQIGERPKSIVFPRNQITDRALEICANRGIRVYRGSGPFPMDQPAARDGQTKVQRALRLANSYLPILGAAVVDPSQKDGMTNIPASRFLRPYVSGSTAIHRLQIATIKRDMRRAAREGRIFHLWFHPHNFGRNTTRNLGFLTDIITEYKDLRSTYGWHSLTMSEAAVQHAASLG